MKRIQSWLVPLAIAAAAVLTGLWPVVHPASVSADEIVGPATYTPTKTPDGYAFTTTRVISLEAEATGYSVDQRVKAATTGYRLHGYQVKCTSGTCTGTIRLACTGSTGAWSCAGAAVSYYSVATGDKGNAGLYTFAPGGINASTGFGVDVATGTGDFLFQGYTQP